MTPAAKRKLLHDYTGRLVEHFGVASPQDARDFADAIAEQFTAEDADTICAELVRLEAKLPPCQLKANVSMLWRNLALNVCGSSGAHVAN